MNRVEQGPGDAQVGETSEQRYRAALAYILGVCRQAATDNRPTQWERGVRLCELRASEALRVQSQLREGLPEAKRERAEAVQP